MSKKLYSVSVRAEICFDKAVLAESKEEAEEMVYNDSMTANLDLKDWEWYDYLDKGETFDEVDLDAEKYPYAEVLVSFDGGKTQEYDYIKYDGTDFDEDYDDKILFYANDVDHLLELQKKDNGEDFYIIDIIDTFDRIEK